jgi:hypothetical protein
MLGLPDIEQKEPRYGSLSPSPFNCRVILSSNAAHTESIDTPLVQQHIAIASDRRPIKRAHPPRKLTTGKSIGPESCWAFPSRDRSPFSDSPTFLTTPYHC